MYGCESWTVKKAERQRIDAFELWCWRRLLRVPWTARRSNQSFLKEISPGISLEGLMLKLKLQYFGHLMRRVDSLEKTLMLGGIGGRRRRGRQRMRWLDGVNSGSWWWTGRPGVLQFMGSQRVRHDWATELNWTEPEHSLALPFFGISLVAQTVKRLPTMQETQVRSLGWEDPLEKEMATHSNTLVWKIPCMEEHGRLQSMGSQSWTRLSDFTFTFFGIGMKTDFFQSCGHCWAFQICWHIECSTFTASSFRVGNSSTGLPSPLLSFVCSDAS